MEPLTPWCRGSAKAGCENHKNYECMKNWKIDLRMKMVSVGKSGFSLKTDVWPSLGKIPWSVIYIFADNFILSRNITTFFALLSVPQVHSKLKRHYRCHKRAWSATGNKVCRTECRAMIFLNPGYLRVQCTPDISRSLFSNNTRKTPMACPR